MGVLIAIFAFKRARGGNRKHGGVTEPPAISGRLHAFSTFLARRSRCSTSGADLVQAAPSIFWARLVASRFSAILVPLALRATVL